MASPRVGFGTLTPDAARELGLSEDVLVALGTNDHSVGALGAGNVTPGCVSVTLGTALVILVTSETVTHAPDRIWGGPHPAQGLYTFLTFAKTGGVVLEWFRTHFAPKLSYDELFAEAASVPIGFENHATIRCPHSGFGHEKTTPCAPTAVDMTSIESGLWRRKVASSSSRRIVSVIAGAGDRARER